MNLSYSLNKKINLAILTLLLLSINFVSAWTGPPGAPPACPAGSVGCAELLDVNKDQSIGGIKTFTGTAIFNNPITIGAPTSSSHAATRGYVDSVSGAIPLGRTSGDTGTGYLLYAGTTRTPGRLYGGTTAPSGTIRLNYDGYLYATQLYDGGTRVAISTRNIGAGDGLSGGGDLTANRTLSVNSTVVRTTGNQTLAGTKTFSSPVVVAAPLDPTHAATKGYVDSAIVNIGIGGYVPTSRTISTTNGITGGGDLTANRTLSLDSTVVRTTGDQILAGIKTFSQGINLSGRTYTSFSSVRTYENVAHYYNRNTSTGTILVTIGNTPNIMLDAEIIITGYNGVSKYHIRGYTYTSTSGWHSAYATCISSGHNYPVRFGTNASGDRVILFGNTGTSWGNYIHAAVTRVTSGYGGSDIGNWSISLITDESGISNIQSSTLNNGFTAYSPSFSGTASFSSPIVVAPPLESTHAATKGYVDSAIVNIGIGGYVPTSRTISTTNGITGGGDLTANSTLSLDSTVVRTTGDQTIAGIKTFSSTISGSITGNAGTVGGLSVHAGRNNEANKVVRTDGSGYIQAGWINTTSGNNGTTAPDRIYASSDAYIRYYTPANFATVMNTWLVRTSGDQTIAGVKTFSSVIRGPNGTAAAPAFTFSADTNTGIYSGGTDILRFSTAGADRLTILANGNVGIGTTSPTQKLEVNGDVIANAYYYLSDIRKKENVTNIENSLSKILQLQGISYNLKDEEDKRMGFSAQELQKVYPELVKEGSDGYLSIDGTGLIAPLVEAIKEQQKKIEELEEKINILMQK